MKNMATNENGTNIEPGFLFSDYEFILENKDKFGSKIFRLAQLKKDGYPVPSFLGIDKDKIDTFLSSKNKDLSLSIESEIKEKVGTTRYAVRSSSFVEDSEKYSNAGRFLTRLDLSINEVHDAILEIVLDAKQKTNDDFSVIIQEYISPDYAGVVFTRNPFNGTELVVEWRDGNGVEVVGGGSTNRKVFPLNQIHRADLFPGCLELIQKAKDIEKRFNFPQDIEWAIQNDKLYILQSRPITSITPEDYENLIFLDGVLPKSNYFYDKSSLEESFSKPLPLVEEILRHLHGKDGAIARAYKSLKVSYQDRDIFVKFKNEIYIDKEQELKQFFPTYSYFGKKELIPHFKNFGGFFTTISNMYIFQNLPTNQNIYLAEIFKQHKSKITELWKSDNTFESLLDFTNTVYTDVFKTNIIAEKIHKDLNFIIKKYPYKEIDLINTKLDGIEEYSFDTDLLADTGDSLLGNSLNISDESVFINKNIKSLEEDVNINLWWKSLPPTKKSFLKNKIEKLRQYEILREEGRWLTVMCVTLLRNNLKQKIQFLNLEDPSLMYFLTFGEIKDNSLDPIVLNAVLNDRKKSFYKDNTFNFPSVLASIPTPLKDDFYGVSKGIAEGMVFSPGGNFKKGGILFVEKLDPSLVQYFNKISGIISLKGGVLSHLAIVAREYNIPVVVNPEALSYLKIGMKVRIDGSVGSVFVIKDNIDTINI